MEEQIHLLGDMYLSGKKTEAYLNGTEKNTGYAYASNVKINFYY